MSNLKDSDVSRSDPKPQASKRTLAIVYALVVLAFAVGLVVTDNYHVSQNPPVQPNVDSLNSK